MNTVFCRKYKKSLEALEKAPMPGQAGEAILRTISKQAWLEWQDYQTMLINEGQLDLRDPSTRKRLASEREKFFDNEKLEPIKGFIPE
mgnify:CR=1 FL=1|tara:strand:- start:321 stop:584 length:264 start_codon:yes stop_codon:yes gene_type:complete